MYNFSTHNDFMSCFLSLSQAEKAKLDTFLNILEESNIAKIIDEQLNQDKSHKGRKPYNPYKLFATIIYAFSKHSGSLRKIEESINYDLRFIYLMEGAHPSYVTISQFLNNVVVPRQKDLFSSIVKVILKTYNISIDDVFVDGTKLEANANKLQFVWKPTAFHTKLNENVLKLLSKYFNIVDSKKSFTAKEIGVYLSSLETTIKELGLSFQTGKGIRSQEIVKDYALLSKYLIKALTYEEQEYICGPNRNSYFKTDHDATAMCLKEDFYSGLGSNMHAAYNVQIAVSKGIILNYGIFQNRSDINTFIPFLEQFNELYGHYPVNICADAGYGSLDNYAFVTANNIGNYVKPQTWQQEMDGKRVPLYRIINNEVYCLKGIKAIPCNKYLNTYPKKKDSKLFIIENCSRCKYKPICRQYLKDKKANHRIFEISFSYYAYVETAINNLLSPKGIELRVNRSSQVENAFGVIKQDMEYDRIRRRGLDKVSCEVMLVCLGYIIRKLFLLIEGKCNLDYWKAPVGLQAEIRPTNIDINKILKKKKKSTNENARKYKYKNS